MSTIKAYHRGFTLIELLLVIAILAILAGVAIVAINPGKQLKDAQDSKRQSDVFTIMNATYQYASDNDGAFPGAITASSTEICATSASSSSCTGLIDLSELTDDEAYLVSIPEDPLCGTSSGNCEEGGVGYTIRVTENGRLNVTAPGAENMTIDITK